jgi:hypothetical protein
MGDLPCNTYLPPSIYAKHKAGIPEIYYRYLVQQGNPKNVNV